MLISFFKFHYHARGRMNSPGLRRCRGLEQTFLEVILEDPRTRVPLLTVLVQLLGAVAKPALLWMLSHSHLPLRRRKSLTLGLGTQKEPQNASLFRLFVCRCCHQKSQPGLLGKHSAGIRDVTHRQSAKEEAEPRQSEEKTQSTTKTSKQTKSRPGSSATL